MSHLVRSDTIRDDAIPLFNDQGFIARLDENTCGSDLFVVNAARVSFAKWATEFADSDAGLLSYLAEHKHMSPFRHPQISFHLKAPEAVMRQAYKHVVGIEWTPQGCPTKDHAWNEISGRYVMYDDVYEPPMFRPQSEDNKQASEDGDLGETLLNLGSVPSAAGPVELPRMTVREFYQFHTALTKMVYQGFAHAGVAKEQARLVMPFSTFTEVIWTCSLEAVVHFIKLRQHAGAQWEIRTMAEAIEKLTRERFPVSIDALLAHL